MYLDLLQEALKNHYDSEFREGVHVSDLTLCMRKSAIRRQEPTPITMRDLNFFTSGRAIHDAIQTLASQYSDKAFKEGLDKAKGAQVNIIDSGRFEVEKEVTVYGVTGHIDLYDKQHNIPIECKSARVKEVSSPKPHHVEQLRCYMAMVNSPVGVLIYQCLMNFEDKPFVEFEITMGEEELQTIQQKLILGGAQFKAALEAKKPMMLDGVLDDRDLNWLCRNYKGEPNCPYLDRCLEAQKK